MSIFNFEDYKVFLNSWIASLPKKGHGEFRRLAVHLNVSTTMISQVFRGDKHLSLELASDLGDFIGLNDEENEYLFLLVSFSRAGSYKLKQKLQKKIKKIREKANHLESRLKKDVILTSEEMSIFYSHWLYSGIRNLAALPDCKTVDAISKRLNLSRSQVQKVVDFLITNQLLIIQDNALVVGPKRTHVGSQSQFVLRHHNNWRLQGLTRMNLQNSEDLFYTAPMSLSEEVAQKIREELPSFIEKLNKMIIPSTSEVVRCLNIDWFEY